MSLLNNMIRMDQFSLFLSFFGVGATTLSAIGVTYKTGFGLDYCALYIHTIRDSRPYSAIADLHTFQFTVPHALEFFVFTSILATDL
jgi:hypothetical protein